MAVDRGLHETLVEQRGPATPGKVRTEVIEAVTELFTRAQEAGVIRADAVPTDTAPIFGMMGVAFDMGTVSSPDLWRRYLAIYLDGLRGHDLPALPPTALPIEHLDAAMAVGKRRSRR